MKQLNIAVLMLASVLLIGSADLFGQGGMVHSRSLTVENLTRDYLLYVPAAYTGQEEWPLVINYHGFGSNATNQMNIHSQMNAVADSGHFLIAYPEGLIVEDLAFPGNGPGWHVFGTYRANHDDVVFTDSLINHVQADFRIDTTRIHATGWSNGGEMAFYIACRLSNRVASVASVSNAMNDFLISSCQVTRPFSTMLIHGTADPFFPWNGIPGFFSSPPLTPSFWASHNNCLSDSIVTELPDLVTTDNSTVTLIEYRGCDDSTEVLFYRVNNGGHAWPGTGPNAWGNTNRDINGSVEIWKFFKRNPFPSPVVGIAADDDNVLRSFQLFQNYPNPFNPSTTIEFSLRQNSSVTLKVYNLLGEEVVTLLQANKSAGRHVITFDASDLAGGIYYYRLQAGSEFSETRKMLLLR